MSEAAALNGSAQVAENLAHADTAQGLTASTEAHGGAAHAEPMALGIFSPGMIVAMAMTVSFSVIEMPITGRFSAARWG